MAANDSPITEDMIFDQIVHAARPGLVCIAPDIDALSEHYFSLRNIDHVEIDIENEIGNLLNNNPRADVRARLDSVIDLAAATIADRLAFIDFGLNIGGGRNETKFSGRLELRSEYLLDCMESTALCIGSGLLTFMVVLKFDAEKQDFPGRFGRWALDSDRLPVEG